MSLPTAMSDVRRIAQGPMRKLFVGQFLNALGSGLTLSLLIVYLSTVRGLPIPVATSLLAWQAILALAISPIAGTLVDRFGPRTVLLAAVLIEAAGVFSYGQVTTKAQAFAATTVVAIGGAGIWGPSSALTARLVPSGDRATAFGFGFLLLNLGLGLGGLIGSMIIDLNDARTFTLLYSLTALTFVMLFVAVLSMGDVGRTPVDGAAADGSTHDPNRDAGSWREVLADRTLLRFAVMGLLMLTFGYGSVEAGVSLYITKFVELDERFIGLLFAANTGVIVVAQLFVLSMIRGRPRTRILASVGLLWGATWLLFGMALGLPTGGAILVLFVAIAVFAVGETLWSPTAPAILNDLAPEHLRGRYNSVMGLLWGTGQALGPLLTGLFLSGGLALQWTLTLAVGCAGAALIALTLRSRLTPEQDGLSTPEELHAHGGGPQSDPDLGTSLRPATP